MASKMRRKINYRAWSVSENDFPFNGTIEQKIRFLAQYGVLAPSTHNTQPWMISIKSNELTIKPDRTKMLPAGDPGNTGLFISIGAFTENVTQAAKAFALSPILTISDDKVVIKFTLSKQTQQNTSHTQAIINRCSNKFRYTTGNKSEHVVKINKLSALENQYLKFVHDDYKKKEIIQLHLSAAHEAIADKKFIHEVSLWLRSNLTRKYDGMPGFVQGSSLIKSSVGKMLARTFKQMPRGVINHEKNLLESSPYFAVIGSKSQQPSDIIRSGMLVEEFWLTLTREGLVAQPLFAMIKCENHRDKLKKSVGMSTIPVFFLRVGMPTVSAEHTPRRPFPWN